jgi:hypothetical protein
MISIRENVFETNSSSCHSLTMNCKKEDIEKFNKGELWYVEFPGEYRCNKFHTTEEIVAKMKEIDPGDVDLTYGYGTFTDGLEIWSYDDADIADEKNFVKWLLDNLNLEMFEWVFNDDPTPKYFSKKILRRAIESIVESAWNSPLYTVEDFFDYKGNVCDISSDYSDVKMNKETKQFDIYENADPNNIRIEIDFRH